ncbi:sensor histidine kinase [Actinomadura formosensis]|uniref:sensor histidine kinase n=1 Tax=Actinomadura formosensis TaxID=60706 RepID=UPI00082E30EC|nr:ATP-binding protein [Actinomadura formosensis]
MSAGLFSEGDAEHLVSVGGRCYVAGMRVCTLIPVAVAAVGAADDPRMLITVLVELGLLAAWSRAYICQVLDGKVIGPSIVDAAVLCVLMITTPLIVSKGWLVMRSSWLRPFTTFGAVGYQYSTPWPLGVGLGAVVCFVGSAATVAAQPGPLGLDDVITAVWTFLSVMLARLLWTLVVGAGRKVDAVFADTARARRERAVADGIRADQLAINMALHDTAAATLLMVGLGRVDDPGQLRRRATRDLEMLSAIRSGTPPDVQIDLAGELRSLGEIEGIDVVYLGPGQLKIAAGAGRALAGAAAEALANVRRHAGTDIALIKVTGSPERVGVEIRDRGCGFDPAAVSSTRRGIRGSILDRIAAAGGSAEVESAPGQGTAVRLVWPDA